MGSSPIVRGLVEAERLSWLVVEPGWKVVSSDGREIGYVEQVVGDRATDIFDGLSIASDLFDAPRYVPSDRVGEITDGRVAIRVTAEEAKHLNDVVDAPPALDVPLSARVAAWVKSLRRR